MSRKILRIRERNQITLPPEVLAAVSVRAGDFLEVVLTGEGQIQLTPARLVRMGTPEAEEADRRAEEDIREGRYRTFDNAEAFAKSLLSQESPPEETGTEADLSRRERILIKKALEAAGTDVGRAAKKLGIPQKGLGGRLRKPRPLTTEER